jgi:hypothetical protein
LLIWAIKSVFDKPKSKSSNLSKHPNHQEPKLVSTIRSVPIDDIEGVRFFENGGNKYLVKIDSIKKIAKYIEYKYKKVSFEPGELAHEREYFIENYASNLSKANYDLVIKTLTDWVDKGGRFEFYRKK